MRIFDVDRKWSDLAEELTVTIMAGEEPTPELLEQLESFKHEGPGAIDQWVNCIQEQDAGIAAIQKRTNQLS